MNDQITPSIDAVNFRIGAFIVDPRACTLQNGGAEIRLGPRCMDVLVYLAERPGEAVSNDTLRDAFWRGAISTPNAVHKAVTELREALTDDPRAPKYIETLPRRGYRLVAPVAKLSAAMPVTLQRTATGANGAPHIADDTVQADRANGTIRAEITNGAVRPRRERWWITSVVVAAVASASLAGFGALWWKTDQARVADLKKAEPAMPAASCDCDTRVAVLPLRSADAQLDGLSARIADGIRRGLANGYAKRIATRAESASHALAQESVESIGKALSVNAVIDGEIAKTDGAAKLSIALYDPEGKQDVYRFDASTPWPTSPQAEEQLIAHLIRVLGVGLGGGGKQMKELGTQDAEAFLAFREGFDRTWRQDPELAIRSFRKATALDPAFARAHYELGSALINRADTAATLDARRAALPELESVRARVDALHGDAWQLADLDDAILRWKGASREQREARLRSVVTPATGGDRFVPYIRYVSLLLSARLPLTAGRYLDAAGLPDEWVATSARAQIVEMLEGPAMAARLRHELMQWSPNNVSLAHGEIITLARSGEFAQAQNAIDHLERVDKTGLWAYSAKLQVAALHGDLKLASVELQNALADPRATALTRGIVRFTLGDVEGGVADWRAMDTPSLELIQQFIAGVEMQFPAAVLADPRYQATLDELAMGARWTAYMRSQVAPLATATGIALGDPAPTVAATHH